jgi:LysM repeat protein
MCKWIDFMACPARNNSSLNVLRLFILLLVVCAWGDAPRVCAQTDPAAREDAQMERQKILRAADQIEQISDQSGKLQGDVDKLKTQVEALSEENKNLKQQLAELRTQMVKEREALINKVAELVQKNQAPAPHETHETVAPKTESGYEYVVTKGDSLWSITQGYQKEGLKITVDDVRRANGLKEGEALKAGQKLFIPKK